MQTETLFKERHWLSSVSESQKKKFKTINDEIFQELHTVMSSCKESLIYTRKVIRWMVYQIPLPLHLYYFSVFLPNVSFKDWKNQLCQFYVFRNKKIEIINVPSFSTPIHFYRRLVYEFALVDYKQCPQYLLLKDISYQDVPQLQIAARSIFELIIYMYNFCSLNVCLHFFIDHISYIQFMLILCSLIVKNYTVGKVNNNKILKLIFQINKS